MRFFLIIISVLLIFSSPVKAEWLACDPAPENSDGVVDNDVVNVVIMQDAAEIIRPYELNPTGTAVLLIDTTTIAQATFSVRFENSQGRRSDPVIFELNEKPAGCSGLRIIH